ncbi:MAG TPA: Fe-S cluster assembly protein SufD [Xanthobacteraceae bacterium]|jgi:Fe-S cluster assembly protein SufD|nr:Fe-S cluster assembly protein SufD [Xanthobacteraceae bacterium]
MKADVQPIKTKAEQALADAFASARKTLPSGGGVSEHRQASFLKFDGEGLPHRRVEEWKYTDLRTLMRDAKPLASPPDAAAKKRAKNAGRLLGSMGARRLVFVDGYLVPELSDLSKLEPGLLIVSMADALAAGDPYIVARLGQIVPNDNMAVALNTAFMGDGAVIRVVKGARIERPIHLVFVSASGTSNSTFTRSFVVVEDEARATLIESHEGPEAVDYQINCALELVVGARAEVDHIKICTDGAQALHLSTLMVELGERATLRDLSFVSGSAVLRNQLFVRFAGENATAQLAGASLLRGRQHVDTTLVVDHAVPGGSSRELFKSVLDDQSRSVFQGKIIVRPGAQKTDGKMMAKALLLSDDAEANSKPELEIFADDVQCGHGATAGALDEDLLFYLRARGIPLKQAEALLIQSFVGEAIDTIEQDAVKDALHAAALAWLHERA